MSNDKLTFDSVAEFHHHLVEAVDRALEEDEQTANAETDDSEDYDVGSGVLTSNADSSETPIEGDEFDVGSGVLTD